MDKEEKRRLKKLGKKLVEEQSRQLDERLAEANPAPVGSDEWVENYRRGTVKDKELRQQQPDIVYRKEIEVDFVIAPIELELGGSPGYFQCLECGDVLYSRPRTRLSCTCKALAFPRRRGRPPRKQEKGAVRRVKLSGKSTAEPGFISLGTRRKHRRWWQFW